MPTRADIRTLLTGGDRRSIAQSRRVRAMIESDPSLVPHLVALTADDDWLVALRSLDLLEKLAHDHPDWVEPHKHVFIGPLAESDKWEIRLQIVRALPLFKWAPSEAERVGQVIRQNLTFPQTFVRAWTLDALATFAVRRPRLAPIVERHLREFERSDSKALQARARAIRDRLGRERSSSSSKASPRASNPVKDFDGRALYAAMDAQRAARGLSWPKVAREIWHQSILLNQRRNDHPISPATLTGIAKRGDCSCQHALFMLRWLGRAPESFLIDATTNERETPLPSASEDRRLRWDLSAVYQALDARRRDRELTWRALAKELRCTEHQLTGIRTARYAIGMGLMMRIVQWLDQPSAAFIYAAKW